MDYKEFLETKKHSTIDYGIKTKWLPDNMFDYQKYITDITIKKGRYADFLDTGTGKTIIELTTAFNYAEGTKFNESELWLYLNNKYDDHKDPKTNKLSHYIWHDTPLLYGMISE